MARRSGSLTLATGTLALLLLACGGATTKTSSSSSSSSPSTSAGLTSVPPSSAPGPSAPTPTVSPSTTSPFGTTFAYEPLWPFGSLADAQAWERQYRTGGQQPWHLDAAQTALSFAGGYLGYTELDRTTSSSVGADGAHVGVGYVTEGARTSTAAVVHLLRFGFDADAPWEVVGTDDTNFSLTSPVYGAKISSPVSVGGRITGVDESIHVQARELASATPVGDACCLPAGGENSLWQTSLTFRAAAGSVVTIAASTGGHIQRVERFTVTGVTA
jgi:hypothetical protein